MLQQLAVYAHDLPTPLDFEPFAVVAKEVDRRAEVLRSVLPVDDAIAALDTDWADNQPALEQIARLSASVEALPDPTDRDAARDYLTVEQKRMKSWRQAMTKYAAGKAKADAAAKVHALYGTTTDKALEATTRRRRQSSAATTATSTATTKASSRRSSRLTLPRDPGLDRSSLCGHCAVHVDPCLFRCAIADAGVSAMAIVENGDVFEEGGPGLVT